MKTIDKPMTPAVRAMAHVLRDLADCGKDADGRELICTPFEGAYGIAGWVVCLNGRPPRGPRGIISIVGNPINSDPPRVVSLERNHPRRLSIQPQLKAVCRFWLEHLRDSTEALTFKTSTATQEV